MGVTRLWNILEEVSRLVKLETLCGKILAVDASMWIYQFLKALRDKEGNYIKNGHIIGFFRRICKLLFYGIKPIFVFDGRVPLLKQQIIKKRVEKRLKCEEDLEKLTEKIFLLKTKKNIEKETQKKRNKSTNSLKESPYFENIESLKKDIKILQESRTKDIYDLPKLDVPFEKMQRSGDFRIMSQENTQDSTKNFTNNDLNSLDFSKIDFNSDFFKTLLPADQYSILSLARLKSRLRMGLSVDELMMMFPNSMEFSKFQITRVKERNDLTQRLLNFNNIAKTGTSRVAGEPNKEYLLIRNEDTKAGWTLSFDSKTEKEIIVINDENENSVYEKKKNQNTFLNSINLYQTKNAKDFSDNFEEKIPEKTENSPTKQQIHDVKNDSLFLVSDDSDIEYNKHNIKIKEKKEKSMHIKETDHKNDKEINCSYLDSITKEKENKIKFQRLKFNNKLHLPQLSDIFPEKLSDSKNDYNSEEKKFISKNDISQSNNDSKILFNSRESEDVSNLSKIDFKSNQIKESILPNSIPFYKKNAEKLSKNCDFSNKKESSSKLDFNLFIQNPTLSEINICNHIEVGLESIKNIPFENDDSINKIDTGTVNKSISLPFVLNDKFPKIGTDISNCFNSSEKESVKTDTVFANNVFDISDYQDYDSDAENDVLIKQIFEENKEHNRFFSQLTKTHDYVGNVSEEELEELINKYRKSKKGVDSITQIMVEECQTLLRLFGIPYITALTEAEAQCAELVRLGLADGIITDDSDVFLFGGTRVYRNMFNHSKYVELYLLSDLEQEFNLGRENLIRLAHLLGSDYTEGVPKIGPVTALEILSDFPDSSSLNEFKEWCIRVKNSEETDDDKLSNFRRRFKKNISNVLFLQNFPNPLVDKAYLEPEVDSNPQQFDWGIPDLDNLKDFLTSTIGWSSQKINEIVIPVIRSMNLKHTNKTQTILTDYWHTNSNISTFISQNRVTNKITRFTKALNNLKKTKKMLSNDYMIQNSESIFNENIKNISKNTLNFDSYQINIENKDLINENINYSGNETESSFDEMDVIINTKKHKKTKNSDFCLNLNKRKHITRNIKKKRKKV
ncbi:hypothetical protein PCANB_001016 [Pneumocystis canis]|nr:hypothetical protein PCANB_001016 [Pneumocystis canis]